MARSPNGPSTACQRAGRKPVPGWKPVPARHGSGTAAWGLCFGPGFPAAGGGLGHWARTRMRHVLSSSAQSPLCGRAAAGNTDGTGTEGTTAACRPTDQAVHGNFTDQALHAHGSAMISRPHSDLLLLWGAAMENKGLNVFNTACVLAKPSTGACLSCARRAPSAPSAPRAQSRPPGGTPVLAGRPIMPICRPIASPLSPASSLHSSAVVPCLDCLSPARMPFGLVLSLMAPVGPGRLSTRTASR
jgi:hypothetical protein